MYQQSYGGQRMQMQPQMQPQMQYQRPMMAPQFQPRPGYVAPPGLYEWFLSVDTDRSGRIEARELAMALARGGIRVSEFTAFRIISMFDANGSGAIDFPEFQRLHPFIQSMSDGFRRRDRTGDGRLDGNEVRAALMESGFPVQEQTFQAMMRKFDSGRKGFLNFDDYCCLSIFLSNVKNTFGFYDQARTGHVTFGLDSFMAACVAVK